MAIVSMVNRKGGVGKTTLTLALADFLSSQHAKRVLIIDMDPQANASLSLLGEDRWRRVNDEKATIADLFETVRDQGQVAGLDLDKLIQSDVDPVPGSYGSVSLIASTPRLQEVEESLSEGDGLWRYLIGSPYFILHQALSGRIRREFDQVLIDCPPALGLATLNALTLSEGYLIPVIPDHISTIGAAELVAKIEAHARALRRGQTLKRFGSVVNRFQSGTRLHEVVLAEIRNKPEFLPVWETIIPSTIKEEEASRSDTRPTTLRDLYGSNGYFTSLQNLAVEFLRRIG